MVLKFKKIALTTAAATGLAVTTGWIGKAQAETIISTSCYVIECRNLDPRSCSRREILESNREFETSRIDAMRKANRFTIAAAQCYRNECEHRAHHMTDCSYFEIPKKEMELEKEPIRSYLADEPERAENRMMLAFLCFFGIAASPLIMAKIAEGLLKKIKKLTS